MSTGRCALACGRLEGAEGGARAQGGHFQRTTPALQHESAEWEVALPADNTRREVAGLALFRALFFTGTQTLKGTYSLRGRRSDSTSLRPFNSQRCGAAPALSYPGRGEAAR